jgi:hypothetical protein
MTTVDLGELDLTTTADPIELADVQALATTSTDHQIDVMLSAEEARQIVKNINGRMEQSRKDLIELYDREGWRALGYSSWGACVKAEFEGSSTALYRQLAAAKIEREVFGDSRIGNPVPASQLEAVKDLPTDQKRAAFQRADQLAGAGPRTAKHIAQAAKEIAAPDLPIDFSIVQRRLASHGVTLAYKDGMFVTHTEGKSVGIATPTWSNVTDRLEYKEAHPDPAHVERLEEQIESGDQEPQLMPTLVELDANRMPDDLHRAGYYWHSSTPPTIALNGSDRRWDAPTIEQAIAGARTHYDAKGEPIAIFPALTPLECKALIREAKMFIEGGADRKLPTIGKILRIAARMALEATE